MPDRTKFACSSLFLPLAQVVIATPYGSFSRVEFPTRRSLNVLLGVIVAAVKVFGHFLRRHIMSKRETHSDNHHANPPGNPVASQTADKQKSRQQQFAAEEEQRSEQTLNVNRQNVPIKQPNKATNNS
jgi:hypothetical protein